MQNAQHTSSREPNRFDDELDGAPAADAGSALRYRPSLFERSRRDLDDLIAEGQMWG